MAKLVFDIETSALPLEQFDPVQQEYLFREAENLPDPALRAARREEIHRQFSLWPLTGQVVCIAMLNADSNRGKVLFLAEDGGDPESRQENGVEFMPCADEGELLTDFWEVAEHYDSVITFNGRGFDVPVHLFAVSRPEGGCVAQGLARLPLSNGTALRFAGAVDLL